ncbi:YvrJ family protein [Exiguobacterium sp. H66]|uniref:YvrJ family protein n=1 Tax=Exiguobacterium sp. H66 TaxID=2751208 RepID=UPI001BE8F236|nr:YvrJ family protein [Exiguobacterium sp. H66]
MTVIELPQWISILGNFGFPIVITMYIFMRFEKKIENLEVVISQLSSVIQTHKKD